MISVLTVTADEKFATACERALPELGDFRVVSAMSVEEAIDVLEGKTQVDCIASDHDLPDTDSVTFLQAVRAQAPTLPFILFTSEGSEAFASRAISAGVTDYLIKERHEDQWDRLATLITDAVRYYRNRQDIVNTEARAKTLLNASNDIIGIVRDREIAYLNDTGVSYIYGGDRGQMPSDSVANFLISNDDTSIIDLLDSIQSGSQPLDQRDGELIAMNGTRVPVEITATRVKWTEEPAVILILRDISELKEREQELRLTIRALDEAPIGVTIADANQPDNPLIYANDKFSELTGYPAGDILGRNCRFLLGENTDPDTVARIREAIDAVEPVSVELRNYRKDGTEFWNHLEIAPVTNDAGEVINYVGFQRDVTERKQRQKQLAVLDRVLRHNLRNDLNVIRGQAETIRSETSGEVAGSAGAIVDKCDQLFGLADKERRITELLREDPAQTEIEVCERLQQITSRVASEHPDATIIVDCSEEVTVQATAQFGQAITELVTNAIVHNDSSSPEVTLSVTEAAETVRIDIADTGPRIPEMERNVLVGEMDQTQLYHGSGMDLWLVNLIITRSNGTITVAENSPAGNIVSIELPQ